MRFLYIFLLVFSIADICMADDKTAPDWTYDDDVTGQEDWGAIEGYETCRTGMQQSPIMISYTKPSNLPKLGFKYSKATGSLNVTKKSFIMEVVKGGTLIGGKDKYTLQSIEIHSPSGHRIRDKFYPLEIHLIHKDNNGDLLIVAVFADIGRDNQFINDILKQTYIKNKTGQFTVDLSTLLKNDGSYYSYTGSMPYPPCTENVGWRIIKNPITLSKIQLSIITKLIGRNTRLPQPVYMRDIFDSN